MAGVEEVSGFVCAWGKVVRWQYEGYLEGEDKPLANWIKASLTGFLRRFAMFAIDLLAMKGLWFGLMRALNVWKVLSMSLTLPSCIVFYLSVSCYREVGCFGGTAVVSDYRAVTPMDRPQPKQFQGHKCAKALRQKHLGYMGKSSSAESWLPPGSQFGWLRQPLDDGRGWSA